MRFVSYPKFFTDLLDIENLELCKNLIEYVELLTDYDIYKEIFERIIYTDVFTNYHFKIIEYFSS